MRKVKLALYLIALSTASGSVIAAPDPAAAVTQGTVTFNGTLIADTCQISSNSQNIIVTLPTISTQTLKKPGDTAGSKLFNIDVEECPADIKTVAAHFEAVGSSGVDSTTGNITNSQTGTDVAKEVQVRLYDSDQKQLLLGDTGEGFTVTDGKASMRYYGGYYATGLTTPGKFTGKVLYTLAYP